MKFEFEGVYPVCNSRKCFKHFYPSVNVSHFMQDLDMLIAVFITVMVILHKFILYYYYHHYHYHFIIIVTVNVTVTVIVIVFDKVERKPNFVA